MKISDRLNKLEQRDIYTLILFLLYNTQKIPEYSSLSQLSYILDKNSLFKLCEYFGGTTIKIPTLDELEILIYALLLYDYVDIEQKDFNESLHSINEASNKKYKSKILDLYQKVKILIKDFNFNI
jgi:hypothetical protein